MGTDETKYDTEQAFRLALHMVRCRYDLASIAALLVEVESLSQDDAARIAEQALLCQLYDLMRRN